MLYTEQTLPEHARPDLGYVRNQTPATGFPDNLASIVADRQAFEVVIAVFIRMVTSAAVGNRIYALNYRDTQTNIAYKATVPITIPENVTALLTFGADVGDAQGFLAGTILSAAIPLPRLYMDSAASIRFDDEAGFSGADNVTLIRIVSEAIPTGPMRDTERAPRALNRFREIIGLSG